MTIIPARRVAQVLLVLAGPLAVVCALAAMAVAQTYVGGLSVSDTSPTPGAEVTVRAAGITANQPAAVLLDAVPLGSARADSNGVATTTITIPAAETPGEHLVTIAVGNGAQRSVVLSQSVDVQTGGDAFTHADGHSTGAIVIAVAAVLAVATGLVMRRRQRARS